MFFRFPKPYTVHHDKKNRRRYLSAKKGKKTITYTHGILSLYRTLIIIASFFISFIPGTISGEKQCKQGFVTLTFDDGYACHYTTVLPLLEKYGLSATFYVTTGLLGQQGYLTPEQVIELSRKGHEIASHGVTHRNLQRLPLKEVEEELTLSKQTLEDLLDASIVSFAPPYGAFHPFLIHKLEKHYRSCRGIRPGVNTTSPLNPFHIRAHVVFNSTSLCEVEEWIDYAIREKKWLVLVYHLIDDSEGIVDIKAETFESHLEAIRRRNPPTFPMKDIFGNFL